MDYIPRMPPTELHLIVADTPLRTAIAEQFALGSAADLRLRESAEPPASFGGAPAAIILDASLMTAKIRASLSALQEGGKKSGIFLLGGNPGGTEQDFVTESFSKPLRLGHLLARVLFHLHAARGQGEPLAFGSFRLDPQARQVVIGTTGAVIRLTEKETHLLEYLGRSEKPVSREELLAAVWGYDARIDTHTLETHIYRLRRKLDPEGEGQNANPIAVAGGYYRLAPAR